MYLQSCRVFVLFSKAVMKMTHFFSPSAGFCLGFESPEDASFVGKGTNE